MRADHRADHLNANIAQSGDALAHHFSQPPGLVLRIAVKDEQRLLLRVFDVLGRALHNCAQRLFPPLHLFGRIHLAALAHADDGLDIQHGAEHRAGGGNAPAAAQILQIVHRQPCMRAHAVFHQPSGHLFHRLALLIERVRLQNQQRLRPGNAQRVHHGELSRRVFLHQLLPRRVNVLNGIAHLRGEGDEQQILFAQDRLEVFQIGLLGEQRCNGRRARAHLFKKGLFDAQPAVFIQIFLTVQRIGHFHHGNVLFIGNGVKQIAVAVRHKHIRLFH